MELAASFVTVNGKLDAINGAVDTEVAAIKAKTDALPSDPADASDIAASFAVVNGKLDAISAGGVEVDPVVIADAILKRDWNLVSGEANYSVLNALRFLRDRWEVLPDGTLRVYQQDGTTLAWQRTVTVDASADPITAVS